MREHWSNLKVPKVRSRKHLDFIRGLSCARCSIHPCDPAHIRKGTDGGTSMKPSDVYTVPLCHGCHTAQHQSGEAAFWGACLPRAIQLAKDLYSVTGDVVKAHRMLAAYRRG